MHLPLRQLVSSSQRLLEVHASPTFARGTHVPASSPALTQLDPSMHAAGDPFSKVPGQVPPGSTNAIFSHTPAPRLHPMSAGASQSEWLEHGAPTAPIFTHWPAEQSRALPQT
jgi:hypothetical protein